MRIIRRKKAITISPTTISAESNEFESIKRNAKLEITKYIKEVIRNHPICLFIKIPMVGIRERYAGIKADFKLFKN
tara:strand:+ start:285 stop:512 length:228 start_codon:yes stop_codon:yes gene_type:complete